MEVKILCPCGAKYKFDVEPLNGRLPGPVSCPVCNADGTELGNQGLAQTLGVTATAAATSSAPTASTGGIRIGNPAQPAPVTSSTGSRSGFVAPTVPRSSKEMRAAAEASTAPAAASTAPAPAPVPVAPAPQAAPVARAMVVPVAGSAATPSVAPNAGAPRLSVSAVHVAQPAAAPVAAPPTSHPPVPKAASRPQKMEAEPSFMRGVMGIAAASFIALLVWFGITLTTGIIFKPLAIGVGAFIGWAGAWLAREKSMRLGVVAASATALAVVIGLVWAARHEAYQAVNETIDEMWKEQIDYAKAAVQASRNDTNLLNFIKENGTSVSEDIEDEEDVENFFQRAVAAGDAQADAKMLSDFKKNELPKLRKFADGKVSKSQFDRERRPGLESLFTIGFIIGEAFSIRVILWIGLAIGAAWKLTSGQ